MTDSQEEPLNNSLTESEPVEDTTAKDDGEIHSGVGVLDKTVKILDALESGPSTLGQLVAATGLARPTAHRLAIALERHRFVLRDQHGRFVLGSRFAELAAAAGEDRLLTAAGPISGPTGRMGAAPGRRYAPLVMAAGKYLTEALVKAVR